LYNPRAFPIALILAVIALGFAITSGVFIIGSRAGGVGFCVIGKARGLYNYTTSDPQELSFNAGDVINILQKDPSGWWQGEINGKIGVFPSTDWIEELDLNGNLIKPIDKDAVPDYKKCRALYAYNSESEYEISITAGEILTIEGLDDDGWYTGWNEKGDYGRFPSNYCADYE